VVSSSFKIAIHTFNVLKLSNSDPPTGHHFNKFSKLPDNREHCGQIWAAAPNLLLEIQCHLYRVDSDQWKLPVHSTAMFTKSAMSERHRTYLELS